MGRTCSNCCGECCPCYEIIEEFTLEPCGIKTFAYGNKCGQFSEFLYLQPRKGYECLDVNNDFSEENQLLGSDPQINNSNYNTDCAHSGCEGETRWWGVFPANKLCEPPIISGQISCTGAMIGLDRFIYPEICRNSETEQQTFYLVGYCLSHLSSSTGGLFSLRDEHKCNLCPACQEDEGCSSYRCSQDDSCFTAIANRLNPSNYETRNENCIDCRPPDTDDVLNWCITASTLNDDGETYRCEVEQCGTVGPDGFPIGIEVTDNQKSYCIKLTNHGDIIVDLYPYNNTYRGTIGNEFIIDEYITYNVPSEDLSAFTTWWPVLNGLTYEWATRAMGQTGDSVQIKCGLFNVASRPEIRLRVTITSRYYSETYDHITYPICPQYSGRINCGGIDNPEFKDKLRSTEVNAANFADDAIPLLGKPPISPLLLNQQNTIMRVVAGDTVDIIYDSDPEISRSIHYYCGATKNSCDDFKECGSAIYPTLSQLFNCPDGYQISSTYYPAGTFTVQYFDRTFLNQYGCALLEMDSCDRNIYTNLNISGPSVSGESSLLIESVNSNTSLSVSQELKIRQLSLEDDGFGPRNEEDTQSTLITEEYYHSGGYVTIKRNYPCTNHTLCIYLYASNLQDLLDQYIGFPVFRNATDVRLISSGRVFQSFNSAHDSSITMPSYISFPQASICTTTTGGSRIVYDVAYILVEYSFGPITPENQGFTVSFDADPVPGTGGYTQVECDFVEAP